MTREVTGYIQFYSRKGRERIVDNARRIIEEDGIADIREDLLAIVDELIKNAIKANYKFLLLRNHLHKSVIMKNPMLAPAGIERAVEDILADTKAYNEKARDIAHRFNIQSQVRDLLNEESRYLALKNRADGEKRAFTEQESRVIMGLDRLAAMKRMIDESNARVTLAIRSDGRTLTVTVSNTAPILDDDARRIRDRRAEFGKYYRNNRSQDYFIHHIDTSDSGYGLGYAKIDSILYHWGLDPSKAATIETDGGTTVRLSLPIGELKKHYGQKFGIRG